MHWQGEELVRVSSKSDLRAGMTVVLDACLWDGRRHAYVLANPTLALNCRHQEGDVTGCMGWRVLPRTCRNKTGLCVDRAIREGRLYRLRPDTAPREQATERRRETVS